ncbi:MAG: hypothetical protein HC912_08565 [Saprospiraceae bacterium]|nr:hypothetical protein [Saprospiraceae bacterium]
MNGWEQKINKLISQNDLDCKLVVAFFLRVKLAHDSGISNISELSEFLSFLNLLDQAR